MWSRRLLMRSGPAAFLCPACSIAQARCNSPAANICLPIEHALSLDIIAIRGLKKISYTRFLASLTLAPEVAYQEL